jgi:DNA-binding transcriptional LysR family regulator
MNIELRHLRYFVAVAEERHFSRAAERLCIAQPPLSQQIQRLEESLGQKLFERRPSVRLTPAGEVLYDSACKILAQLKQDVERARRTGDGLAGTLNIGFPASALLSWLPEAIRTFREQYPEIRIELRELSSADQLKALSLGTIDVGFVRGAVTDNNVEAAVILKEPFVAAVAATRDIARRAGIELADLAGQPFILFPRNVAPSLHDEIQAAFHQAGFTPDVIMEAQEWLTILGLVESDLGVTLVPASLQRLSWGRIRYAKLTDISVTTSLSACTAAGAVSIPARRFTELVRQLAEEPPR